MPKKQHKPKMVVKIQDSYQSSSEIEQQKPVKTEYKQQDQLQNQKKNENTLSILTKQFIQLIKSKENMTIDSNDAAKELQIQKRRIYDITNVLQGIGYIQKVYKNKLRWVGGVKDPRIGSQIDNLDAQISTLQKKKQELSYKIEYLSRRIKLDFDSNKELNYIRLNSFKEILSNIKSKPKRAIIVKAQPGTIIKTFVNQDTGDNQIIIYFQHKGKCSVYLVNTLTEISQAKIVGES